LTAFLTAKLITTIELLRDALDLSVGHDARVTLRSSGVGNSRSAANRTRGMLTDKSAHCALRTKRQ
jgi:hypothetical protein